MVRVRAAMHQTHYQGQIDIKGMLIVSRTSNAPSFDSLLLKILAGVGALDGAETEGKDVCEYFASDLLEENNWTYPCGHELPNATLPLLM